MEAHSLAHSLARWQRLRQTNSAPAAAGIRSGAKLRRRLLDLHRVDLSPQAVQCPLDIPVDSGAQMISLSAWTSADCNKTPKSWSMMPRPNVLTLKHPMRRSSMRGRQ